MRYAKGQKAETRKRILEVASRRFREQGIAASGIATVMADADLTNGAFYGHFESKEDLVREAMSAEITAQNEGWRTSLAEGGLEGAIRFYLHMPHRDNSAEGCASAALLSEIGRQPDRTRRAYSALLDDGIDIVASGLTAKDSAARRAAATAIIALIFGTLQMARAVADREKAAEILEDGVQAALRLGLIAT